MAGLKLSQLSADGLSELPVGAGALQTLQRLNKAPRQCPMLLPHLATVNKAGDLQLKSGLPVMRSGVAERNWS